MLADEKEYKDANLQRNEIEKQSYTFFVVALQDKSNPSIFV